MSLNGTNYGMAMAQSQGSLIKLSGVKAAPKWTFRGKPTNDRRVETPGPGQYSPPRLETTKQTRAAGGYGFGTSPRDIVRPSTAPGPGEYNPQNTKHRNSSQYGFGTAMRQNIKSPSQVTNPGPGSYENSAKMGYEGPKYTAGSRRAGQRPPDVPGPGSYHSSNGAPSDLNQSGMLPHRVASPKWGFGTSPRAGLSMNQSPGPGAYNSTGNLHSSTMPASPKFTMRIKSESKRQLETPGPGSYSGQLSQFGY
eukprot:TRINITY_DN111331_c0_g1_i1.p1 TRINITY_DN111331_c0_g1~~TRINITY_DN111331_c0_g1_i1.p1  ORF type:complete len:252 (-),score=20.95 TRINITY_DN111331_c0_g1_i1:142-897(-)